MQVTDDSDWDDCDLFMLIPLIEEVVAIIARRTPTIFVADDSSIIREVVSVVLRSEGLEIVGFVNGAELLEAALRDPPNAIVLDIEMPIWMDLKRFFVLWPLQRFLASRS